jgi:2-amino-4-hydroxy-6-hydroxymethyldihydropteridine diphosphokinase
LPKLVYLSLGSNVGNREANLHNAIERLSSLGKVQATSSFYETEPVEFLSQPWFLNCVVAVVTERTPTEFLRGILQIEQHLGRERSKAQSKGPRSIDIDILLFGEDVVDSAQLTIPHPAMHQRRFVLEPLLEIAADARHPVLQKSVRDLCDALPPGQTVRKYASG